MMKIYETLCELKNCSTLTGRVIEQRLSYTGTRYPEINRKVSGRPVPESHCVFWWFYLQPGSRSRYWS